MLTGIKLRAYPTEHQRLILSQWMGCARYIWNAKCIENKYYSTFARKYCSIDVFAPVDQTTSQFKDEELSPWLKNCPFSILGHSATNWYSTYVNFMRGKNGKPTIKKKNEKQSIHLTRELFEFKQCDDGNIRLFVGTKTNNIGFLSFKKHKNFNIPNSIYITKECGKYHISFCYETEKDKISKGKKKDFSKKKKEKMNGKKMLDLLSTSDEQWLQENVIGIDRGVTIPVHTGDAFYDLTEKEKNKKVKQERHIKRLQRKLARQKKGSNRREKTRRKLARRHADIKNKRTDFLHKTSKDLVEKGSVFVFEDLNIQNMTKKAKPKKDEKGNFIKNCRKAKAGLNKSILEVGWGTLETFVQYKAKAAGKAVFKINSAYTSQECSNCGHIHSDNRETQSEFLCLQCGHHDNADRNAALVIKKRAIALILHSGTELRDDIVLTNDLFLKGRPPQGDFV